MLFDSPITEDKIGRAAHRLGTTAVNVQAFLKAWLPILRGEADLSTKPAALTPACRTNIEAFLRGILNGIERRNAGRPLSGDRSTAYLLALELLPREVVNQPSETALPAIQAIITSHLAVLQCLQQRPADYVILSVEDLEDLKTFLEQLEKRGDRWHRAQQQIC